VILTGLGGATFTLTIFPELIAIALVTLENENIELQWASDTGFHYTVE